ncbi:DUF4190 domain-containing protein [Glycomyces rhizosphaerae]|uniref:DUF4190 domain-containing protein n=1 Tax=Glycomyces rhizosphaerae TaxID=2054422 RepID=A0ABV7PUE0_9ACTN
MTTYPPTPGPPEPERPEPSEPEGRGETEEGATPFSGNQPGPSSERTPRGATPGETPPADEPQHGMPSAPPPPGSGPGAPPPSGGGYSPYAGGSVPPPPPPPPTYNSDGPMYLQQPRNGLGKAALICGIIAVVLSFIPGVNMFTWPMGVLAVVFGSIGWSRVNKGQATNKSMAVTGLVLGIASFLTFCLVYLLLYTGGTDYWDTTLM